MHAISQCIVTLCHLSIAEFMKTQREINVRNLVIVWDCSHNLKTQRKCF